MTTLFSNPGSTEVPLLSGLPDDFRFVLALHEGSVVGIATGWAIATGAPGLVILHTTAGLGNAAGALATARVNRAPLVVLVGQQDRRHLALEPFLAGQRLQELAGSYPIWSEQPVRAQDVPAALLRAHHAASAARGPALLVVPMDDWDARVALDEPRAAPIRVERGLEQASAAVLDELAVALNAARAPAIVAGAGADDEGCWLALAELAITLAAPVWQEPFGARAGFPQDHPLFTGHLPSSRGALRAALQGHDAILVVGAGAFRQYHYEPGALAEAQARVFVLTQFAEEAHRSAAELALVAAPAEACRALISRLHPRQHRTEASLARPAPPPAPAGKDGLSTGHVLAALAERLEVDTVLVEECPSARTALHARIPARRPMGYLSAAMGGLGFAIPAAIGVRMAQPERPVVAVVGDGSSLYAIQALWSAAQYRVGALFVILDNARYAIMDMLAEQRGGRKPWPALSDIDIVGLARGFGCEAHRIERHDQLLARLDEALPTLRARSSPLLLDVSVDRE